MILEVSLHWDAISELILASRLGLMVCLKVLILLDDSMTAPYTVRMTRQCLDPWETLEVLQFETVEGNSQHALQKNDILTSEILLKVAYIANITHFDIIIVVLL